MTTPIEIDHEYTDDIVCPHCGYAHENDDDWEWHPSQDTVDTECDQCGKEFRVWRDFDVTYTTKPIKKNEGEQS